MYFTDQAFAYFLVLVFALHWLMPWRNGRNLLLLVASYTFYGWVHPWFCILVAFSTLADYSYALGMTRYPSRKLLLVWCSVATNLTFLGWFKYFNFFVENFEVFAQGMGFNPDPVLVRMFLPVGISFYTFQSMSYTIDVYRGHTHARTNLIDFALFVCFFPQLVAGPIERAGNLLPQFEAHRRWQWENFGQGVPLIIRGYLKKVVVADNIAIHADKAYSMEHPTFLFLAVGTLAFTLQILADWSGYTDIARGLARLFGIRLTENFKSPYLSLTPSEYWRRWHITFCTWLRDYLFIPLGGSKSGKLRLGFALFVTMTLSGIWHGAAWTYLFWGMWHGILTWGYHLAGFGGKWRPKHWWGVLFAWSIMFTITNISHLIIRAPSMGWLIGAFRNMTPGFTGDSLLASMVVLSVTAVYSLPMFLLFYLDRWAPPYRWLHALFYGVCLVIIYLFHSSVQRDFFYFQF